MILVAVRVSDDARPGDSLRLRAESGNDTDTETTRVSDRYDSNNYNGSLIISVQDSQDPVRVGDTLTYNIRFENRDSQRIYVDARAFLDSATSYLSASDNGYSQQSATVQWDRLSVEGQGSRTVLLTVRVNNRASYGSTLYFRVEGNQNADTETTYVQY
jgi:hypothetical protein